MTLRFGYLFAGIGGFDLAFQRAGLQCAWQVEIDSAARSVLQRHWPDVPKFADVCECGAHNLMPVDVVCGGFPCQDLSVAGKRLGFSGQRSVMFYEMVRIVDELRPAFLVWENVPGLLSSRGGADFWHVLNELDRVGYSGAWTGLDARWFGLAQRRRRIFGVFARADIGVARCAEILSLAARLRGDTPPRGATGQDVAGTLGGSSQSGGFRTTDLDNHGAYVVGSLTVGAAGSYNGQDAYTGNRLPVYASENDAALPMVFGGNRTSGEIDVATACNAHGGTGRHDFESETFVAYQCQGSSVGEAGTLRRGNGHVTGGVPFVFESRISQSYAVPFGVRRLTPTECERLQGFPDGYTAGQSDSVRYRQLGNAVAVPVVEWISRRLVETAHA